MIAAYFAVENYIYAPPNNLEDAIIWVLEPHILNQHEGFGGFTPSIEAHLCKPLLKPAFTNKGAPETGKVLAVMAAERDVRMFVQQGCFTIHSDSTELENRQGCQRYLSKIVIPAQSALRVASEIDVCGIRQGDIFPDLGHLATELTSRRMPF
jgi:hypothetical protein